MQHVQEGDERRAAEAVVLVGVAPRVVHLPLPEAETPGKIPVAVVVRSVSWVVVQG